MTNHVPLAFQVFGPRPTSGKKKSLSCKGCGFSYEAHSGTQCAICKEAIEHHTEEGFAECLAGQRRMARARFLADVELDDVDRAALADG